MSESRRPGPLPVAGSCEDVPVTSEAIVVVVDKAGGLPGKEEKGGISGKSFWVGGSLSSVSGDSEDSSVN